MNDLEYFTNNDWPLLEQCAEILGDEIGLYNLTYSQVITLLANRFLSSNGVKE